LIVVCKLGNNKIIPSRLIESRDVVIAYFYMLQRNYKEKAQIF